MKRPLLAAMLALSAARAAAAQDFAQQWIDKVTRETQWDRGPLPTRALAHEIYLGAIAYYDDNVMLDESDEEDQTAVVPFVRVRVDYSERQVDAAADVLASYKRYIPDEEFSDYEQRGFGRVRYVSPRVGLEVAEIIQNVSDPVDAVFADRVERLVSNTYPRASLELSNVLALEISGNIGVVRYWEEEFETSDNWSVRSDFSVVGHLRNGFDLLAQSGVLAIRYLDSAAPPDTDGFYLRGGVRGELTPVILVNALAGWSSAESDDYATGVPGDEEETADVAFNLQWIAAPKTTVWADFTRQFAYGGSTEAFATVNRATLIVESTLTEEITGRLRGQGDLVDGSQGSRRTYFSASASATYRIQPQVYFEGGVTRRWGEAEDLPGDTDWAGTIWHLGIVATN
jgi:hypothetical protein